MAEKVDFQTLQEKWTPIWQEEKLYETGSDPEKPKYYCLDFFPYPSGSGLSVGHMRNYIPTDVLTRVKRMQGFNVLHPMGWDAFGLPAENYALKQGVHPKESTAANVANYKRQMALAEISFDWSKEVNSTDPSYYHWTQWFFLLLHRQGLAYQSEGQQWFCELCPSVLANEQVVQGKCWRHDSDEDPEVKKKPMRQWYFKITDYAERLLDDLELVDWPSHIKKMQQNWIGKSRGARLIFTARPEGADEISLPVYTTRPDTVYGATYMVISPEHPDREALTHPDCQDAVEAYCREAAKKTEIERLAENKTKTGVFTGTKALNPYTEEEIPIWVGDYVLAHYGTGAIMAVPAHDTRDFAFAKAHDLPIRVVIVPQGAVASDSIDEAYTLMDGELVASRQFNGMPNQDAIQAITAFGEEQGFAAFETNYKFRDWLISRQRYWGAPIPIIHCEACGEVPVPDQDLPVVLPELEEFKPSPDGRSPLGNCQDWLKVDCPQCQAPARRETDTMDGFACSSWYFLRFPDPENAERAIAQDKLDYWLPVDLYVGGAEHAVMHLLYARFWTKVMQDAGFVDFPEPFLKLRNQGMMLAADGSKMSKSKGNVVTPDEVVDEYGTDVLRCFILFLGSFESEVPWSPDSIKGIRNFLVDVQSLVRDFPGQVRAPDAGMVERGDGVQKALTFETHRAIEKVQRDLENFSFNTAVSALMELKNGLKGLAKEADASSPAWSEAIETLLVLLAPFAPFLAEELWESSGRRAAKGSVHRQSWPQFDSSYLVVDEREFPVQINGKIRDKLMLPVGLPEAEIRARVLSREKVQGWVEGKDIAKFMVIKDRLVSIVVKG